MSLLYSISPCQGRNPRTGKRVGSRHRWEGCICKWCGKFKDDVRVPFVAQKPATWLAPPCDFKSKFCDGKDVRHIQRIHRFAGRMVREGYFHWCKGCRTFMNGGFRYPKPDEH